eukprot:1156879-Pelagomonas_calceolata.AAC.2
MLRQLPQDAGCTSAVLGVHEMTLVPSGRPQLTHRELLAEVTLLQRTIVPVLCSNGEASSRAANRALPYSACKRMCASVCASLTPVCAH